MIDADPGVVTQPMPTRGQSTRAPRHSALVRGNVAALLTALGFFGCASTQRLSYEGRSTIMGIQPISVMAVVTIRNNGSATVNVPQPICPLRVWAYATPERNTVPMWKSGEETCISTLPILPPIAIGPKDYHDFSVRVLIPRGLVEGTPLYLAMRLPVEGGRVIPIGQIRAGSLEGTIFSDTSLFRRTCIEADSGLAASARRCTPRNQQLRVR